MKNESGNYTTEQAPAPVGRELLEARLAQVKQEMEAAEVVRNNYNDRIRCLSAILLLLERYEKLVLKTLTLPEEMQSDSDVTPLAQEKLTLAGDELDYKCTLRPGSCAYIENNADTVALQVFTRRIPAEEEVDSE